MRSLFVFFLSLSFFSSQAGDSTRYSQSEIIYGRKDGMALTMLKLTPKKSPNGKGIIRIVSGNWKTDYNRLLRSIDESELLLDAGYTVFAVMPSSQPMFTILDEIGDCKRAVRFIRYHAKNYSIDPDRIGITGASSGGHLSLMVATADKDELNTADPVDRMSARVQAVVAFFPPVDFTRFGANAYNAQMNQKILVFTGLAAAFDFKRWNDSTQTFVAVTDAVQKKELAQAVSPLNFVTPDDPPTLIFHGDKDMLVPMTQSKYIIEKFNQAKVPNELVIRNGAGHGWKLNADEEQKMVGWFDKYLE